MRALLYKNAELYLKKVIETIKQPILGPITQNTDLVLNVARVYVDLGQFVQAEKLYQMMTLEFARRPYWVDGYENRRLLEQYAEMLCNTGREIEAEQKYDQVRQIARQQRKNNTNQKP